MKKSYIVRLVFAVLLTAVAIYCCVAAVSIRVGLEQAKETVDSGGEAVGFIFGAMFGILVAILFAAGSLVAGLISGLLSAFGLRIPVIWLRVTFAVLLVLDVAAIATAAIGTFAGL